MDARLKIDGKYPDHVGYIHHVLKNTYDNTGSTIFLKAFFGGEIPMEGKVDPIAVALQIALNASRGVIGHDGLPMVEWTDTFTARDLFYRNHGIRN